MSSNVLVNWSNHYHLFITREIEKTTKIILKLLQLHFQSTILVQIHCEPTSLIKNLKHGNNDPKKGFKTGFAGCLICSETHPTCAAQEKILKL